MKYNDEKIVQLKKELDHLKYTDIEGEGVFVNHIFVKFRPREIGNGLELYIPEEFIDMPEEMQHMKYPSVSRPQRILTSLDSSVNFTFSFVDSQTPDEQIESLTMQMKEIIHKSNPAAVFDQEQLEYLDSGRPVCMFDFLNYSVDEQLYNMVCFTPLGSGTLHATFICLEQEAGGWKDVAWKAFQTIRETDAE